MNVYYRVEEDSDAVFFPDRAVTQKRRPNMKIAVLNGSPKGEHSITFQTVRYLEAVFSEHTWTVYHVGAKVNALPVILEELKSGLGEAELILFAYPVYTFIAPSQLHRTIAFLKENGIDLRGKYMSQITTSKHFYDVTAHRYIEDNALDMGMKILRGLSGDMNDLLTKKGRKEAEDYFRYVMYCVEHGISEPPHRKLKKRQTKPAAFHMSGERREHNRNKRVVIVTDYTVGQESLHNMIVEFRRQLPCHSRVVNLRKLNMHGGCLGCFHCASDGKCVYTDKFDTILRKHIQTNDAIVYAFEIRDHSMGALFKMYDDRQFCNGHRTVTMGMPMAYLVSGNYREEPNLQMVIEGRAQVGGNYLSGVVSDEDDDDLVAKQIRELADKLIYAIDHDYQQPKNFYGVGGMKIFRDLIYVMRGFMKADHKFYKKHGFYKDFPQRQLGMTVGMSAVGVFMSIPALKKEMQGKMTEGMLIPYDKMIKGAERKR